MNQTFIIFVLIISLHLNLFGQKVINLSNVAFTVSDTEVATDFLSKTVNAKVGKSISVEGESLQRLFGIKDDRLKLKITSVFIGAEEVQLLEFKSKLAGRLIPFDSHSNDLWFQHIAIVVKDMDKAYQYASAQSIEHVSSFPQTLPEYISAAAGISAFYFRDQDDHNMELIYFPKGKGNPKWQTPSSELFLGIDHSAIGISNTDQSLKFYRDVLGLKVEGNSENYGTEQEHLNQVFGARLIITGLSAGKGFGVEFLQYITPTDGRLYPKDSTPLDHWYWHTAMQVDNLEELHKTLKKNNYKIISYGIQAIPIMGYEKVLIVRDPDGHAVLLYQKK